MDWQNRWRECVLPALVVVLTSALCASPSFAQQQPAVVRSIPATTADTNVSGPDDLHGTTLFGEPAASRNNQLTDFNDSVNPAELSNDDPDQRARRDRDAFENPPAGHDPRYFQIEIEPLEDRRTRQFFEAEPFPHVGLRLGSFILFQEFEVASAWDSNVFLGRNARGDWRADLLSETRLISNWANHALELRMLHDRSYHRAFTQENDAEQTYELRGRLDITRRTNLEARAAHEIRQESRNSIDSSASSSAARADVITDRANLILNHRFNRLSLQLRGSHTRLSYEEPTNGTTNDRDLKGRTLALRAQWEFRPTFSVFGEFERDERRHPAVASTDGLSRNSDGERYRAGIAFGQTGEYFRGEASIGYGIQRPEARGLPDIDAFLVDANVAWRVTALTSLLFDARTDFGETTLNGAPGVVERRIGVSLRHAFSQRLIGETGVSFGTQDYRGATLTERDFTLDVNVEYTLNRHAALFSRYQHVRFRSSDADRGYDANTLMIGARLRN